MRPRVPPVGNVAGSTYHDRRYWRRYQEFLPGGLRVTEDNAPREQWWSWRGRAVHVDRMMRADAPVKLLALHGVGGYGRLLAPYGQLPGFAEYEFLAPDLPGFGLTETHRHPTSYAHWVACIRDLIAAERTRDRREIVLFGVSTGGRLAYDVAASGADVHAVITTCLADARRPEVRRMLAGSSGPARWAGALTHIPPPVDTLRVPMQWVTNVAAISNHSQVANLVRTDPVGGASGLPLRLARTCLTSAPIVPPEVYSGPPLLLACPEEDHWLPASLSRAFLARMRSAPGGPTRYAGLHGAGHMPVEESGLADLDCAVRDFLDEFAPSPASCGGSPEGPAGLE